jgi:hypothetical protein
MEWIFVLLGVPVGIVATMSYDWIRVQLDNARHGRLRMSGSWAEYIPRSNERQFSVGSIRFKFSRGQYVFDGTNYNNDGTPFCRRRTVSSHVDRAALEFHYTFLSKEVDRAQSMAYGYGVVNLVKDGRFLVPADGEYMYADSPESAMLCNHSMVRIEPDSVPATAHNVSKELRRILPVEWKQRRVTTPPRN